MVRNWLPILVIPMMLCDATTLAFAPPRCVVEKSRPARNRGVGVVVVVVVPPVRGGATTTTSSLNASILLDAATKVNSVRNLAVAGRIPWAKLVMTKDQAREIISIMRAETHALDVAMIFILSVFLKKIGRFI